MLRLDHLVKSFHRGTPNEVRALRDVSLTIETGSFTVIIGTNGSGKSTLLSAVAGSIMVDSGRITLGNRDITSWPEHRRAALVARVFQDPFAGSAPSLSIAENLALAQRRGKSLRPCRLLRRRDRSHWRERLAQIGLGLEDRLDDSMELLSGGQRQCVTLAMASLVQPELLLLDEHTAALDPRSADLVIGLTKSIVQHDHPTTLMVTHSMQQAASLGDRLIAMHLGSVALDVSGDQRKEWTAQKLEGLFLRMREEIPVGG